MHKRLKNMRKIETRKQKLKDQKRNKENDDDEEEFEIKKKPKTCVKNKSFICKNDQSFNKKKLIFFYFLQH